MVSQLSQLERVGRKDTKMGARIDEWRRREKIVERERENVVTRMEREHKRRADAHCGTAATLQLRLVREEKRQQAEPVASRRERERGCSALHFTAVRESSMDNPATAAAAVAEAQLAPPEAKCEAVRDNGTTALPLPLPHVLHSELALLTLPLLLRPRRDHRFFFFFTTNTTTTTSTISAADAMRASLPRSFVARCCSLLAQIRRRRSIFARSEHQFFVLLSLPTAIHRRSRRCRSVHRRPVDSLLHFHFSTI